MSVPHTTRRARIRQAFNPVDIHVGSRMRLRRTLLGLSQDQFGQALGLTFQQVQKYERGANRIGASRLFDAARILDVPVGFFFDQMPATTAAQSPAHRSADAADGAPVAGPRRDLLEMVRAYEALPDWQRTQLRQIARTLAERSTPEAAE